MDTGTDMGTDMGTGTGTDMITDTGISADTNTILRFMNRTWALIEGFVVFDRVACARAEGPRPIVWH